MAAQCESWVPATAVVESWADIGTWGCGGKGRRRLTSLNFSNLVILLVDKTPFRLLIGEGAISPVLAQSDLNPNTYHLPPNHLNNK